MKGGYLGQLGFSIMETSLFAELIRSLTLEREKISGN